MYHLLSVALCPGIGTGEGEDNSYMDTQMHRLVRTHRVKGRHIEIHIYVDMHLFIHIFIHTCLYIYTHIHTNKTF